MGKLENLTNTTWMNATADILSAEAAYKMPHAIHHFYMITSNVNSIGEKKTEHQWQKDSARRASRRDW